MDVLGLNTANEQRDRAALVLSTLVLPAEISTIDVNVGTDAAGEPALWLLFHVRPDVTTGKSEVERLTRFTSEVQSKLFESGISLFPYTVLEQAA